uniref:DM domain-containing protein n=1 Tax=Schistocephalus solidus TaxID=70667 RepID=A0A183SIB3_SCHSO
LLDPEARPATDATAVGPHCRRCRNHQVAVTWKGHKKSCPYRNCPCDPCRLINVRKDTEKTLRDMVSSMHLRFQKNGYFSLQINWRAFMGSVNVSSTCDGVPKRLGRPEYRSPSLCSFPHIPVACLNLQLQVRCADAFSPLCSR